MTRKYECLEASLREKDKKIADLEAALTNKKRARTSNDTVSQSEKRPRSNEGTMLRMNHGTRASSSLTHVNDDRWTRNKARAVMVNPLNLVCEATFKAHVSYVTSLLVFESKGTTILASA
eukprot:382911-Ditylum_brightwellii.AAC.1